MSCNIAFLATVCLLAAAAVTQAATAEPISRRMLKDMAAASKSTDTQPVYASKSPRNKMNAGYAYNNGYPTTGYKPAEMKYCRMDEAAPYAAFRALSYINSYKYVQDVARYAEYHIAQSVMQMHMLSEHEDQLANRVRYLKEVVQGDDKECGEEEQIYSGPKPKPKPSLPSKDGYM